MDFNKISTFLKVAETKNVTTAAAQLYRSQSAISQQILALEEELGIALFVRKHGKVFLTKDGETLAKAASDHLGSISDVVSSIRKDAKLLEGHIRIGLLDDGATPFRLTEKLSEFKKHFPKIGFTVWLGTSREVEERLINNEIDVGILINFQYRELFDRYSLSTAEHALFSSKSYLETFGPINNYKRLLESDLIDFSPDFVCLKPWIEKNCPSLVPSLMHQNPKIQVANHYRIHDLVVGGGGVAIMPTYLIQEDLKNGTLIPVMEKAKSLNVGLDIAIKSKRTHRLSESKFISFLTQRALQ